MKRALSLLVLSSWIGLADTSAQTSNQVKGGIFNPTNNVLSVRAKPSVNFGPGDLLSFVFVTMRWPSSYGVSLGAVSSPTYGITKNGGEGTSGAYKYQEFYAEPYVGINWTANTEVELFTIPVNQTASGTGTFELTNAIAGGEWYIEINGAEVWDSTFYQRTVSGVLLGPPLPPTLVLPANGATGQPTNPTLTWNASSGAASYRLQVSTDSTFATVAFDTSGMTDTLRTITGLAFNTTYYWHVNATNASGTSAYSARRNFTTLTPVPTLSSLNPASGNRLQTLSVGFKGSGFVPGVSSVNVGDSITVNSTTVQRSDSLTAGLTIKAGAALGSRPFSVTNSGAGTSDSVTFTVNNPAPTLTSIKPTSGNRLQSINVGFKGSGFISGVSSVNVGPGITVNSTTVQRSDSLTANITITDTAATGARSFTVTNSTPGGGTSTGQTFTVNNPAPTLSSIKPTSGNRLQTLDVGFKGANYISGVSSVNVGPGVTVNTTTVNRSDSLTANITITDAAATGIRTFTVTNAGPGGGTSSGQSFTVNNPAPTLTSVNPASGNRLQVLAVGFKGSNFISGVSTVSVGAGITVNTTTVNSSDSLTANISISSTASTGARNISVTNPTPGGGTATLTNGFTVNNPPPTLTSINPTSGTRLQSLNVGFKGANFISGVSSVVVGDSITVNSTTVNSSDSITANLTIKAGAALGVRAFSVTNSGPGGGVSGTVNFTVNNPTPTLVSINPPSGARLQTLDVGFKGTDFIGGVSSVNVGDSITVNTTTVQRSDSLTANITIKAGAALGARPFSVTNSGAGTSGAVNFTVNNPAPTLVSINPTSGARLQTLDVGFKGTDFIGGVSSVNVGDSITVNTTTVQRSDSLTANITIKAGAALGVRGFTVTNTGAGTSGSANFTVNNPTPTLTGINPTIGTRLQTLDVGFKGTNFIAGVSSVNVGDSLTVNTTTVQRSDSLTANITIKAGAALGARPFSVTNSGAGTSGAVNFTVNNPAPTLVSISPTSGARLQTLDVGFKGTNFIGGVSSVNVGDSITVNTTTVQRSDSLTANITIKAGAALGARPFSVTNTGAGTSGSVNFTVNNPGPILVSINPTSGGRLQTLDVGFKGMNFIAGVSSVNAGDSITVNTTTVQRSDSLTANITIKAGAALGARPFSVTNTGAGTSGTVNFTVNNPVPTLTSINPTSGTRLQTMDVGFKGTNFIAGVSSVNVGDSITVNSTTVQLSDSLTANLTIKAGAVLGSRSFSVTNNGPGGGTSEAVTFTVNNPGPTLTSINPTSGTRLQTLDVGFKGTNFIAGVSSVIVGDSIAVNSVAVQRSDSLTANITIGAGAALGPRPFSVTNAGAGTSGTQTFSVVNVAVNAKVFLQGPYSGGSMGATLNTLGFIPLTQPYSGSPWNYAGSEHVASIPANVVDWILVELRTDTTSVSKLATRAVFLKTDGSVVDTSGLAPVKFDAIPFGNYHIVVRQRNHLAIMSPSPVALNDLSALYDFTASQSNTYGIGGVVQVGSLPEKWAMWAGDVNGNGQLKYSGAGNDRALILVRIGGADITATVSGYYSEDVNMNGIVKYSGSGNDRAIILVNIGGTDITATKSSTVPGLHP